MSTENDKLLQSHLGLDLAPAQLAEDRIKWTMEAERGAGLHDRENPGPRVKWVNLLRGIVARRCPKNKSGTSLVSDIDLLLASDEERQEAFLTLAGLIPPKAKSVSAKTKSSGIKTGTTDASPWPANGQQPNATSGTEPQSGTHDGTCPLDHQ